MKSRIAEVTVCVDEILLQRAVNQRAFDSKMAIEIEENKTDVKR